MLDLIVEPRLLGLYITNRRRPISNYVNREREADRIDFIAEQLYADERYRINQMDRNAIHARERWWGEGGGERRA